LYRACRRTHDNRRTNLQFKLAVANTIVTRVKGICQDDAGKEKPFEFQLEQDRVTQSQLEEALTSRTEGAAAFLKRVTKGWRNQHLVLNEDGSPAEFSEDAFDALLSISGMPGFCWTCYRDQVLVRAKN
jgi:G3E family GTPase